MAARCAWRGIRSAPSASWRRCATRRTRRSDLARRRLADGLLAVQMQTLVDGVKSQFQAIGDAKFIEDVMQMVLHRLLADEHLLGHFLVLVALCDQSDDLALTRRKRTALAALAGASCRRVASVERG